MFPASACLHGGDQWHTFQPSINVLTLFLTTTHIFQMTVYKQLLGLKQKYQTISYLAFITHINLLQQSARQSKDIIE